MMSTPILTTSHYGVVRFGDLAVEAVVLEDGTRGYVQRQLATAIGLHESRRGSQLKTLLTDVAPGAAEVLQENACSIRLPSGQTTAFFPAGVISEVASGVIDAALEGRLHRKRQHLVPNCQRILKALAKTGEVALIDEATGYQYHRAPDALQALISRLLRERVASWERRFSPDYYRALFRLFGWLPGLTSQAKTSCGFKINRWQLLARYCFCLVVPLRHWQSSPRINSAQNLTRNTWGGMCHVLPQRLTRML